ncbi:hypothetical protein BsWGS_22942 [Bradybaena similaris]
MCRWGCSEVTTTFMCKWCGTRFCRACLRGEFPGQMKEATTCAKCKQNKCQGQKVETVLKEYLKDDENSGKQRSRTATGARSTTARQRSSASGQQQSIQSKKSKTGATKSSGKGSKRK